MNRRLLKIAVAYWVVAVCWGAYMGIAEDFTDISVHAHLNLLGWVSLTLCGLIYTAFPALMATGLAKAHFWLHNLGLPILMIGVWLIHRGMVEAGGPITGIATVVVIAGILSFAINFWRGLARG